MGEDTVVTLWTLLPPPAVGVTPPVRIETSSAAVTERQTLDLNCMVAGQGHPHVTWYRRGGALPPNSQVGHGGGVFALQATTLHQDTHIDVSPTCHVPRCRGPACALPKWQWLIQGSMCVG